MIRFLTYFKNLRFKQKLFISYMVVSIIPLLVLGTFSYKQASRFLLQQAEQNLDGSIGQMAETINYRAKQHESIINSITQNIVFKQIFIKNNGNFPVLYRDYVDPFFSNILDFNKDILQISVFTDNRNILRGEYILPIQLMDDLHWGGHDPAGKQTQWNIVNGKLFATRLFIGDEASPPVKSPAILFISIDPDSMFQGLSEIQSGAYGVRLTDQQGKTLLSKYVHMEQPKTENGSDYLYLEKTIPETGWKLICFTPKQSLSIDAKSIVGATVLMILICLLILVFVIWIFSNTFVNRINRLNKKMMIVENGNLKIDVSSTSRDEIGQLTNRFGKMLTNINTLIDEAYQSKITQKEAELKALQTQINPHFLYNTLSIINWKALQIDAMEISQITNTVSRFYRTVLNKGKNFISVKNEIENAKAYMEIQLIMHNNNFDFICEVEEELLRYDMINLIFQPILENALEHGIDQLRKGSRRGRIALRGFAAGGDMEFSVEDNGPGMSSELIEEVLESHSAGYGIKNVHDRIQIRFGNRYGVKIKSEPGRGTQVCISTPKYTAAEHDAV